LEFACGRMPVLFVGEFDATAGAIARRLFERDLPITIWDGHFFHSNHPAVFESESAPEGWRCEIAATNLAGFSGVLTNVFSTASNPSFGEQSADEQFWQEWGSFLAGPLTLHHNVINPPSRGSWSGWHPTWIEQLGCLDGIRTRAIKIPPLSPSAAIDYYSDKEVHGWPFFGPPPLFLRADCQRETILFLDDEIVSTISDIDSIRTDILDIVFCLRASFRTRMGQIGITRNANSLIFSYFITRPQLGVLPSSISERYSEKVARKLASIK
jgi:hypothetical protein